MSNSFVDYFRFGIRFEPGSSHQTQSVLVLLNLAVTFLEYWKRYSARLAHRWDVEDVEREEIRPRPEFALKVC